MEALKFTEARSSVRIHK